MIKNEKNEISIGIITPPIGAHSLIPLSNLLNILLTQSQSLYLITGNEGYDSFKNDTRIHTSGVNHTGESNIFLRIITFFLMQIRISIALFKVVKKCDIWIFFLGGENLVLPMCIAKIFGKKVFLMFAGSSVHTLFYDDLVKWLEILTNINCLLSDRIIVYSKNLVNEWNLVRWKKKILFCHEHFIDCERYSPLIQYSKRDIIVSYVGRLSEEKGIWNFIFAINLILKKREDIKFLIIGDGLLREKIEKYIDRNELRKYIKLEGWISHDELPTYLNRIKLLILPSYTEGLPNIMLEALSCGTPILTTSVGSIPDIISDGETGFILEDNTPECIASNVLRVLDCPYLVGIAYKGRKFVEAEFSFIKAVERWRGILKQYDPSF